jgi:hypothetical protein
LGNENIVCLVVNQRRTWGLPEGKCHVSRASRDIAVGRQSGLASYHQVFRYGDTCIGKKHSRFTVSRINGQLVTGDYRLVENDIAYYNECPNGTFVMTAEEAEKLCRAEAAADEVISPVSRRPPPLRFVFLFR